MTVSTDTGVSRTARARARAQITAEILAAARARLATDGAAGLSLRAVARDVGMVSSAVYRYFPSRDDLLTALITESYDDLGAAAEGAEGAVARADLLGRWLAVCHALRDWALANPHAYALLYGSPVPGYAAPEATVPAGTRIPRLLLALVADIVASDRQPAPAPVPRPVRRALAPIRSWGGIGQGVGDDVVLRALTAWAALYGAVSLELFGQYGDTIGDPRPVFDAQMRRVVPLRDAPPDSSHESE